MDDTVDGNNQHSDRISPRKYISEVAGYWDNAMMEDMQKCYLMVLPHQNHPKIVRMSMIRVKRPKFTQEII